MNECVYLSILNTKSSRLLCRSRHLSPWSHRSYSSQAGCHGNDDSPEEMDSWKQKDRSLLESLSAEDKRRLQYMQLEVDLYRQRGKLVPEVIADDVWMQLMRLDKPSDRVRLLKQLFRQECHAEMNFIKQQRSFISSLKHIWRDRGLEGNQDGETSVLETLSAEDRDQFKDVQAQVEVYRQGGKCVPEHIPREIWLHLLHLNNENERHTLLKLLHKEQAHMKHNIRHQELDKVQFDNKVIYGWTERQKVFLRNQAANAMRFGPEVIVDLGFDAHMKDDDARQFARHLYSAYCMNMKSLNPFHMKLCNADLIGKSVKALEARLESQQCPHGLLDADCMMTVTQDDFMDLYPPQDLIYLTRDAPKALLHFNPNATYIIGGLFLKGNRKRRSYAKACKLKVQTLKLPLDRYLSYSSKQKEKDLPVDQVLHILLLLQQKNDWPSIFRKVLPWISLNQPDKRENMNHFRYKGYQRKTKKSTRFYDL